MKNEIHNLVPGSDPWLRFRLGRGGASEAAAMLGLSKNVKRSELLRMKHTGLPKEFSDWVQTHVLDYGHEVEAEARKHFEALIGEDLYPIVCSIGRLSASADGLTMDGSIAWEHKQWSEELARSVAAGVLPEEHWPQCQQVLMITGAKVLVFGISNGTADKAVSMEVYPDAEWFERIHRGWEQFWIDLEHYELPPAAAPAPVGKVRAALPALRIEVTGQVTTSNLAEFKTTALTAIRGVNRELKTDEDFADAEKAVKWCSDVEQRLAAGKDHALSQTVTIDALFRAIDEISAEARQVRLDLEKLVKGRKEAIKGEIVAGAVAAFGEHVRAMNCPWLPRVAADFAGAAKNKRTVASLQDAVDTELARVKIEANGHYQRIQQNHATLGEHKELSFLFSDYGTLVLKAPDDLALVIRTRIADHEAKEAQRLENERARIQAEEQAKAQREAEATAQAARLAAAMPLAPRPAAPAPASIIDRGESPTGTAIADAMVAARAPAPKADEPATLNLGAISERLEFTVPGALIAKFGIEGAPGPRGSRLFTETQFIAICARLIARVATVRDEILEAQAA